jgi:cytochrome c-type biogenesis protein CcmE
MAKHLDDELAKALADSDDVPEDVAVVPATVSGSHQAPRTKGNLILLAALIAIGGGLVVLFLVGFKEAAIYALPTDQAVARASELAGRKLRVDGELVPGTLAKRDQPCEFRFRMQSEGKELAVRYPQCVIPDTFRDRPEGGVMVTVEGQLSKDGGFDATLVMAKCTSKYDPATHEIQMPDGSGKPPMGKPASPYEGSEGEEIIR